MSRRFPPALAALLVVAAAPLGGCAGLGRALGTEKVVPDEFAVVSRAPLAVPPDYSLRPPRPGAAPTQETSPTDQAKHAVFRANEQPTLPDADKRSEGENLLLKEAHANEAAPDIRATITQEAKSGGPVDESFVDKLMIWKTPDYNAGVIDPNQEMQRLRGSQAAAAAGPTPEGMTGAPVIERAKSPALLPTF